MKIETKENVIFIAASLINLADMAELELREVVKLVGADAIRELLDMERLRFEVNYEEMAEEICFYVDWEPTLVSPWRLDKDLSTLGLLIAEVIDSASPAEEEVPERLYSFLSWDGIGEWLSINGG